MFAVLATGCVLNEDIYVDFDALDSSDLSMFQPTTRGVVDLSNGLPDETILPDGTSVNEFIETSLAQTKATSCTINDFIQNFLKWQQKRKVIEISGIYRSTDEYGKPITLSGKVIMPADGAIKRVILVSHYTMGANRECPSNSFPLEGQLAQLGYAVVVPDYIGYGITSHLYHPYLMMELTARGVVDMYLAVHPFLKAIGREPENPDIYLMGYSQGGAVTMATEYLIERDHGPESARPIDIKRVFAGGGIYDIKATFESYIESNTANYPCGVPFVIVGMIKGNHLSDDLIDKLLLPRVSERVEEWFLEKNVATLKMNQIIGSKQTDDILTPLAFDRTSAEISLLYQVMTENSILSLAWQPKAPVYMMHSIEDDTIPFAIAAKAKVRWASSNIQYNFGYYGSHQICCMRFVYTVKTILENEE